MDSLEMKCMACELEASEASEADVEDEEGGVSNIVALLIVLGVVAAIVVCGVVAVKRSEKVNELVQRFGTWKARNRQKLNLFYAQVMLAVAVGGGWRYGGW
jgi:hypothetical protein